MYASIAGRTQNVKFLLDNFNYAISQKSKTGLAAIHYAVLFNHMDTMKELIKAGADVNQVAKHRKTPLIQACINGNMEIVKYLIKHGAKYLKTDAYKRAGLTYAIINGHVELVSYLLSIGAEFQLGDVS